MLQGLKVMNEKLYNVKSKIAMIFGLFDGLEKSDIDLLLDRPGFDDEGYYHTVTVDEELSTMILSVVSAMKKEGSWIEVNTEGTFAGQIYLHPTQLAEIPNWIGVKHYDIFNSWAKENDLLEVSEVMLRNDVAEESIELKFDINAKSIDSNIQSFHDLFSKYGLRGLGNNLKSIIDRFKIENFRYTIGISTSGLTKLGFIVDNPSRELGLFLAGLSKNHSDEKLAQFEAMLLAESPNYLSFCLLAKKWKTEFNYTLENSTVDYPLG